jgi:hypothetical protein
MTNLLATVQSPIFFTLLALYSLYLDGVIMAYCSSAILQSLCTREMAYFIFLNVTIIEMYVSSILGMIAKSPTVAIPRDHE